MKSFDRYQINKTIAIGGMGEISLAFDPVCNRTIAIKRIKKSLKDNTLIIKRFLNEAKIASSLTHPSILPIYSISTENNLIFYTMPYIEGETLKEILKKTKEQEKNNQDLHQIGGSIPELIRIFLSICEAIAYSHHKEIIHRDLKPDNVIIGKYGEVYILDWGIAKYINQHDFDDKNFIPITNNLTRPGKLAGTLSHIAPELSIGEKASYQSDIYALGIILYQMLTLSLPFNRKDLISFKKTALKERLIDPLDKAPYREIPHELADITKKCLHIDRNKRYQSAEELINDIKDYIEGKPQWSMISTLDINKKKDWSFNENILVAKHTAIIRNIDIAHWVNAMVSSNNFSGNIKIEASIQLNKNSKGFGFLLSIPDIKKNIIENGYCIWIGAHKEGFLKFYHKNIPIIEKPEVFFETNKIYKIKIEKTNNKITLFINNKYIFSYEALIPLPTEYIGVIYQDTDFDISGINIFSGSSNLQINCLTLPDTFLSKKDFKTALLEYRRIGKSFPGREEGREALFRAGITLLEQAKNTKNQPLLYKALNEFEFLSKTPGAPLEYLGKALTYQQLNEFEEEAKCLELAIRKFKNHPLYFKIKEHLLYRVHESSLNSRESAYRLILIALRHIDNFLKSQENSNLLSSLEKHSQPLFFLKKENKEDLDIDYISIKLAFMIANKRILIEILKSPNISQNNLENCLFALVELGCISEVSHFINSYPNKEYGITLIELLTKCSPNKTKEIINSLFHIFPKTLNSKEGRVLYYILEKQLLIQNFQIVAEVFKKLSIYKTDDNTKLMLDIIKAMFLILQNEHDKAKKIFKNYKKDILSNDLHPLYYLYGCYLHSIKDPQAEQHFKDVLETSFPISHTFLSHYLINKNFKKNWINRAFRWEKKELYKQLSIYYHCTQNKKKRTLFLNLAKEMI
jgi:eukaryotic-like serine/threonine-protein kinase